MAENGPTTRRVLRRFTLGSGPLKRTSDRLEFCARLALLGTLLLAVAIALAVGTASYGEASSEAAAQALQRHRVSAELTEDAGGPRGATETAADTRRAAVVWTDRAGVEHELVVTVPAGGVAGSTVPLWIDQDGDRTTPPLTSGDASALAVGYALLTYIGIALAAYGAHRGLRRLLDGSRARRWAAEWAVVEPVWTRKVP